MDGMIVVDMQKDFCYPDGALYVKDAHRIIGNVANAVRKARECRIPVIFTQDWHPEDDEEFNLWPKHCIENSRGAEIVDEIDVGDSKIVKKRRYSAFFGTELDEILRKMKIGRILVCGVCTNICVLYTVADARFRGYEVVVLEDCTAATSDEDKEYSLKHMRDVLKADVKDSGEIFT